MELYSLQTETCLLNTSVKYQSYETGAAENFFFAAYSRMTSDKINTLMSI